MRYLPDATAGDYTNAVAAEMARVLTSGGWHDFEELSIAAADVCCQGEYPDPCRELVRLHVFGRLKNWLGHGLLEVRDGRYRATGEGLFEMSAHAAAMHCGDLLETVRATARGCDDSEEDCDLA